MRFRAPLYLSVLLFLAACAAEDVTQSPADPASDPGRPQLASPVPNPYCDPNLTSAVIRADLEALFIKNAWPDVNSTKGKFKNVEDLLDAGNIDGARDAMKLLINFINNKYGNLTPAEKAASKAEYDKAIADLWCFVGISGQVFDLNPGDPVKAFDIPGVGGVQFPANAVPTGTLVSLTNLSNGPCPLLTTLDCFPGYISISLYPFTILSQPATVVICPPSTAPTTLAVGHQSTVNGFEVLPLVGVPSLLSGTCSSPSPSAQRTEDTGWLASAWQLAARLFLPKQLEASPFLFVGGVGGLATDFSPFGAVNTNLTATGGVGGAATEFTPPAASRSNRAPDAAAQAPDAAPPQNPPLPPAANLVTGNVGSTSTTGLPSVTIATQGGDADGVNPIAGVTVSFTTGPSLNYDPDSQAKVCDAQGVVPASGIVQVVTNGNGVATLPCLQFGTKAGFANLSVTFDATTLPFLGANQITVTASDGSTSGTSLNWLVQSLAGQPTQLVFGQSPSASAAAGVPLGQQPSVQLLDALGNEVYASGVVITAAVTAGGGTASYTAPVTTVDGLGVFNDLSVGGQVAGVTQTLSFSFPGIAQPLTSTLNLTPGPASKVVVSAQPPATVQAGVSFGSPAATIQDQFGNVVSSTATVVASLASGSPTLAGTTSVAAVAGVATFGALRIDGAIGPRTLKFSSVGLTASAATSTIDVVAGPAAKLSITRQPAGPAPAGAAFGTQPIITILDQFDNPVTGPATVTAQLASGAPALAGTTSVSAVSGVATFTNLRIDGVTGDRTLSFTSGGLTSPASSLITVTPGAVASIKTFINGNAAQTYSYGTGLTPFTNASPAPRVIVTDAFGNGVANQTVYWSATTSNGGVLTVGATGTPTGANGTAQVTSWLLGDGLNQATAGLFAPNQNPTIPGYLDAEFSASTPTGISVFACTGSPGSKADLGAMSIKAPNGTIKKMTILMSITGQSNALSNYDATLEARLDGPTGTLLKSTTGKVQLPGDNGNPVPVTFTFPTSIARQTGNHTIWFLLSIAAPTNRKPQVWYTNSSFKSNDPCNDALIYAPGSTTVFKRGLSIDVTN